MSESPFDIVQTQMAAAGPDAAFASLAEQLRRQKKHHELFDSLLMQARHRLGLPVVSDQPLDDLPEPKRTEAEQAYLEVCREVGELLLAEGKYREAWMYLRPVGDRKLVATALERAEPDEESLEEVIEIALHEGVAPARGFQLVLEHYGTCNAITTFEGTMPRQPLPAQKQVSEMLVRHLHRELLGNVKAHVEDRAGSLPQTDSLAGIVAENGWIFENDNYHIDTSHLSSTVRFARLLEEPAAVELAWELTEYGRRLSKQFQFAGEEPFADVYPSHGLLFAATLARQVDEAVEYFRSRAESIDPREQGTAPIETYLILLKRLQRYDEALEATARLVPQGVQLSPYAPRTIELARLSGSYQRYLEICRERNDLLAFAAGLAEAGAA